MMRPPTYTRRAGAGFTLLEVVTVAAVASIIFLVLLRWLSTLGGIAGNVAQNSVPIRNASYVEYRLANDLSAAAVCDPVNGSQIRTLNDRVLELYINGRHADGTPGMQMVRWNAESGNLTRTAWDVSLASNCLPQAGSSVSSRVMATDVYTGAQTPFFTAVDSGVDIGQCETVTRPIPGTESESDPDGIPISTPSGDGCFTPTIRTQLSFIISGQDVEDSAQWDAQAAPSRLDRTFSLPSVTRSTL